MTIRMDAGSESVSLIDEPRLEALTGVGRGPTRKRCGENESPEMTGAATSSAPVVEVVVCWDVTVSGDVTCPRCSWWPRTQAPWRDRPRT